jgi:Flp pilus assembly protein TadG
MRRIPTMRCFFRREGGSALVEMALIVPILMVPILGAVDFGRGFYLGQELASAAHAGAAYGAQNPTDTAGMKAAALAAAPDLTGISIATPTYGCECANGSSFNANCSSTPTCTGSNAVYLVSVTATVSYTPLIKWPGIPSPISISTTAKMRSAKS